jgi:hypothetical protein
MKALLAILLFFALAHSAAHAGASRFGITTFPNGRAGAAIRPPVRGAGPDPRRHEAAADERGRGAKRKPYPSQAASAKRPRSTPPKALRGLQVEKTIFKLVQSSPGMGTVAIAKATAAGRSTPVERLKRLQAKGRIERDGVGWRAPA